MDPYHAELMAEIRTLHQEMIIARNECVELSNLIRRQVETAALALQQLDKSMQFIAGHIPEEYQGTEKGEGT